MVIRKVTFEQVALAIRTVVIGWSSMITFSLIILGGAVLGADTESSLIGIFCVLAGLFTFIIMIILFVIVETLSGELRAAFFLWILWFAGGGGSIIGSGFVGSCTRYVLSEFGDIVCQYTSAITILGFLNGILYMFYSVFLLVSARYRNIDVSTRTNLTAARINNTQIDVNNEVSPPNDCPSSV